MAKGKWRLQLCFLGAVSSQEGFKSFVTSQMGCPLSVRQMGSASPSRHENDPGPAAPGEDLAALPAKFLHPGIASY